MKLAKKKALAEALEQIVFIEDHLNEIISS